MGQQGNLSVEYINEIVVLHLCKTPQSVNSTLVIGENP